MAAPSGQCRSGNWSMPADGAEQPAGNKSVSIQSQTHFMGNMEYKRNIPSENVILVIGRSAGEAEQLKQLIEFMDVCAVRIAEPDDWRPVLGERRLAAMFLGADVGRPTIERLIGEVGETDHEVAFVLVDDGAADA